MKIIRHPEGTERHQVELTDIQVPNLWHIASQLREQHLTNSADTVLECWSLCYDLLWNLRNS